MTLNQAFSTILSAGRLSVDLTYPGGEGGHWVRDNIPIALFLLRDNAVKSNLKKG